MNPDSWGQIKQIYHSALELEPGRREEFLREACVGDASLFKEVTSLLAQDRNPDGLFESPAMAVVAQALGEDKAQKAPLAGRTLLHYRIEEKIGQGGMLIRILLRVAPSIRRSDKVRMSPEPHKRHRTSGDVPSYFSVFYLRLSDRPAAAVTEAW